VPTTHLTVRKSNRAVCMDLRFTTNQVYVTDQRDQFSLLVDRDVAVRFLCRIEPAELRVFQSADRGKKSRGHVSFFRELR
jgi:hypothetical protein